MGEITTFSHQSRPSLCDQVAPEGSFSDQVARLLDRIEYRRADSAAQREAIFRLRYQAYMRDGTIAPSADGMFSDPYDEMGNVYLFGLYLDGVLASSLRLHVGSADQPDFPSREVFPDFLQPLLDAGEVIVDPTRFVVDDVLARLHRALPYATLRLCGMTHNISAPTIFSPPSAQSIRRSIGASSVINWSASRGPTRTSASRSA
jgi:hypothetical protein